MQRSGLYATLLALAAAVAGCSEQTRQETDDALKQTGEAVESAAEDAANVVEGAVEGASDAADENQTNPD